MYANEIMQSRAEMLMLHVLMVYFKAEYCTHTAMDLICERDSMKIAPSKVSIQHIFVQEFSILEQSFHTTLVRR